MKSIKNLMLVVATSGIIAGCGVPKLNDESEKVRVLSPDEVTSCRELGKSSASVLSKVAGIPRPESAIEEELETMGRNAAADMGGDTIVPLTVIEDGKRSFQIYKCVDPNS
jgi:hypothetical protein